MTIIAEQKEPPNSSLNPQHRIDQDESNVSAKSEDSSVTGSTCDLSDISDSSIGSIQRALSGPHLSTEARKEALIDYIMDHFHAFFTHCPRSYRTVNEGRNGGSSQERQGSTSNSSGVQEERGSSSVSQGKRNIDHVDGDESGDQDDDYPRSPKRRKDSHAKGDDGGPNFACPYFKRNRKRYQLYRSCPGPGWKGVHRMK
jgi:hypothetical protein